jgi:hypothetical protein
MQYYFNELSPTQFQRLINTILVAQYGDRVRLTPLYGADGGRDGETAPDHPLQSFEVAFNAKNAVEVQSRITQARIAPGRYIFQVKHHRTNDARPSDARAAVLSEFEEELTSNVLPREGSERANFFFLITNVPASKDALAKLDKKRRELLKDHPHLHADIWWQEQVTAFLDQLPYLGVPFPELFAGRQVPALFQIAGDNTGVPRALRLAMTKQFDKDSQIKFRQITLEARLSRLFVDLDVKINDLDWGRDANIQLWKSVRSSLPHLTDNPDVHSAANEEYALLSIETQEEEDSKTSDTVNQDEPLLVVNRSGITSHELTYLSYKRTEGLISSLWMILNEDLDGTRKLILEGGPGQGKSTVTQMIAQIHRQQLLQLDNSDLVPLGRWSSPKKARLVLRLELRLFADWLKEQENFEAGSVERYLCEVLTRDSGGATITVDALHSLAEDTPTLLIFDGLDEVGSDDLRDEILNRIADCVNRLETGLNCDLRVIVTTRPPAIAGRQERLPGFRRLSLAPLSDQRTALYVNRWVAVQIAEEDEQHRVRDSFNKRRTDFHVAALARNPMQLSVLLHFIRLKGEAFPDQRAQLYQEYFKVVIDRDVEKSAELRQRRTLIEELHQLLGYKIHALTEAEKADRTLSRAQLMTLVDAWLREQNEEPIANELFRLGEERLGLIISPKGEGEDSRYGFEIQPVQEYFAAAFINGHTQGDAHAVFSQMLRRQYWREVALFLAGLRRPNEKADLIARAREIDSDAEEGWRQAGRAVILRLLNEGVFSQRPVHTLALDYVLEMLDPRKVPLQAMPPEMTNLSEQLAPLISQGQKAVHTENLVRLLKEVSESGDLSTIHRILDVLRLLLSPQEMHELAIGCSTQGDPEFKPRLLLSWMPQWQMFDTKAAEDEFGRGASETSWCEWWWKLNLWSNAGERLNRPLAKVCLT